MKTLMIWIALTLVVVAILNIDLRLSRLERRDDK
jgi:hypothetical protein